MTFSSVVVTGWRNVRAETSSCIKVVELVVLLVIE
jgi:hypothetical protein